MHSPLTSFISSTSWHPNSDTVSSVGKSPVRPITVRDWALAILESPDLETKLWTPIHLTDEAPGPALRLLEPARSFSMRFQRRTKDEKLPKPDDLTLLDHRATCLHRFGGHELLAVEMIAWALLAFPEAPRHFRKALVHQLKEEQEHVRLYQTALRRFDMELGDQPMYKHFWAHLSDLDSPLSYLSCMNLTLEQANLDFAPMYGAAFTRVGDAEAAQLMAQIFSDEIGHVRLGWHWFERMRPQGTSSWDAWMQYLPPLLHPVRARGGEFRPDGRRQAGLPEDWIIKMGNCASLKQETPLRSELRRIALSRSGTEQHAEEQGSCKSQQNNTFCTTEPLT